MSRALRIEYPGAIYHVMNRGDRREPIFRDDRDHVRFLETLGKPASRPTGRCMRHRQTTNPTSNPT
jgi:putative transposase